MTNKELKQIVEEALYDGIYNDKLSNIKVEFQSLVRDFDNLFIYTSEEYIDFLDDLISEAIKDEDNRFIELLEREKDYVKYINIVITKKGMDIGDGYYIY